MRSYLPPASFVAEGGTWPDGPFLPEAPYYATATAGIVQEIQCRMGTRSIRSVAADAGYDPTSMSRLLRGHSVPDLGTIVALVESLGGSLVWRK